MSEKDPQDRPPGLRSPGPTFVGFLADTWRVARRRFLPLFALFAFANFVAAGIIFALLNATTGDSASLIVESSGLVLDTVLAGLAGIWASRLWVASMAGNEAPFSEGGKTLRRRLVSVLLVCALTGLMIVMLYVLLGSQGFLILGFMLAVPLTAGPPVLLHTVGLEDRGVGDGAQRARELIKGGALRTYVYLLMLGLIATLISGILLSLIGAGAAQAGLGAGSLTVVGIAVSSLFLGLSDLFLSAALLTAYLDARERHEDFEPEELFPEDEAESQ